MWKRKPVDGRPLTLCADIDWRAKESWRLSSPSASVAQPVGQPMRDASHGGSVTGCGLRPSIRTSGPTRLLDRGFLVLRLEPPSCAPDSSPPRNSHPCLLLLLLLPLHPPSLVDFAPRAPPLTFSQDAWAPCLSEQAAPGDVALRSTFIHSPFHSTSAHHHSKGLVP